MPLVHLHSAMREEARLPSAPGRVTLVGHWATLRFAASL